MADDRHKQPGQQPQRPTERRPEEPPERPKEQPPTDKKMPAQKALDHLRETGLPSARCKALAEWLEGNGGAAATAENLYAFLEETTPDKRDGTLRRTGKFIFGKDFEPEHADVSSADELKTLREQTGRLKDDLETHKAWLRASRRRTQALEEENEKLRVELVTFRRLEEARGATV